MTTVRAAIDTSDGGRRSECWCCGTIDDPEQMVHLGNHPEVGLCIRCVYWLRHKAREVEDLSKTGWLVRVRDKIRRVRSTVIERDLHRHPVFGPPLRWLGRRLP